jgi:uncharacterized protein YjbI with pentapeptide repeats
MEESDFYEAQLTSVTFVDTTLARASLSGATFAGSELRGCDLTGVKAAERLRGVRMPWVDVVGAAAVLAEAVGIDIVD